MTDECPSCVPDGRRGCVLCDHTGRVPADVTPYTVEAWRERALRAEAALLERQYADADAHDAAQDRVAHARFMAAGWRRRAKESRKNALTAVRWAREARAELDRLRAVAEAAREVCDGAGTAELARALAALDDGGERG